MFNGRTAAGRQLRGFGLMAAQGTASPNARAWLHRQVKHEALQPCSVARLLFDQTDFRQRDRRGQQEHTCLDSLQLSRCSSGRG